MMLAKKAMNTTHVRTEPGARRACPCCMTAPLVKAKRAQRRRDRQAFRTGRVEY